MLLNQLDRVKQLLQAAGSQVEGKKKFQKLAYLCQVKGTDLGLDFTFHYYGVYSATLNELLYEGQQWNIIELTAPEPEATVTISLKTADQQSATISEPGFRLVSDLKDQEARVLEVLSTIVYLSEEGYSTEEIKEKLPQLKGHLKGFYPKAYALARQHFHIDGL